MLCHMPIFDPAALSPGVRPREVLSWAGYDFANSGYTTVVLTAVFNAYFVSVVAADADWGTLAWTVTLAVSNAAVMIAMPMIGAYADLRARKQWLLRISTVGCVASTAALALAVRVDVASRGCNRISNFFFQVASRDRRFPAGDRAPEFARQGLGWRELRYLGAWLRWLFAWRM